MRQDSRQAMIYHEIMSLLQSPTEPLVLVVTRQGLTMIWTHYYYLLIILPCVSSLHEDLSSNNLFETDYTDELESSGVTTEPSLVVPLRDSLTEVEGIQNIIDISLEDYWRDSGLNDSQSNRTELVSEDVEILRLGEVFTST